MSTQSVAAGASGPMFLLGNLTVTPTFEVGQKTAFTLPGLRGPGSKMLGLIGAWPCIVGALTRNVRLLITRMVAGRRSIRITRWFISYSLRGALSGLWWKGAVRSHRRSGEYDRNQQIVITPPKISSFVKSSKLWSAGEIEADIQVIAVEVDGLTL